MKIKSKQMSPDISIGQSKYLADIRHHKFVVKFSRILILILFIGLWEFTATREQFQAWVKKYHDLMNELTSFAKEAEKDPNSKVYFVSTTALQIDEPSMDRYREKEKNQD